MTTTSDAPVEPLAKSLAPLILPEVAVKLWLGGSPVRDPRTKNVYVTFGADTMRMHDDDFHVTAKIAYRLRLKLGKASVDPSRVIEAMQYAHKFMVDELFRPNDVRVLYYPVHAKGSAFYRCILPAMTLTKGGNVTALVSRERTAREAMDFDVVVIQIDHSPATIAFANGLKKLGKKVVFELDDDFEALEPWHPCYELYRKESERDRMRRMLGTADAVTVTTEHLRDRYRAYNPVVAVLPNCIPLGDWPQAEPHGTGEFRVLWAGSPSHFGDLEVVADALWDLARARQNVRLVFFGREPKGVPDDLANRVLTLPFTDFENYPVQLADVKADVAIAPLADVPFNLAKSNLKLLEYGATGYPIVASDVGPYRLPAEEKTHPPRIVCRSGGEWRDALEEVHANADLRGRLKAGATTFARSFDIEARGGEIERFFLELAKGAA